MGLRPGRAKGPWVGTSSGGGGGLTPAQIDSLTTRYIGAAEFYTPLDSAFACNFYHYVRDASGTNWSWPSWEMPANTYDPMVHATFALPDNVDYSQAMQFIPYFGVNSVGTGTGIRFDIGARFIGDGEYFDYGPGVDQQDTVITPAVDTLYYGTPHLFVPTGLGAQFLNVRVRRIYGGSDAPPDQYTGNPYFVGLRLKWSTL